MGSGQPPQVMTQVFKKFYLSLYRNSVAIRFLVEIQASNLPSKTRSRNDQQPSRYCKVVG